MVSKKVKGSSTLEGAIIFPIIFIVLFSLILIVFFFFNRFNILASSDYTLREKAYTWYDDKKLYDDVLGEALVEEKLLSSKRLFNRLLEPTLTNSLNSNFSNSNFLLYRSLVFEGGFNGFRSFSLKESFPYYRGSVFVRNYEYTKEMINDALGFLSKEEESENEVEGTKVFIVDDNMEEKRA